MTRAVPGFKAICLLLFCALIVTAMGVFALGRDEARPQVYENHSLLRVAPLAGEQLEEFMRGHYDIARGLPDGGFEVVATPVERDRLTSAFDVVVQIENMEEEFQKGLSTSSSFELL